MIREERYSTTPWHCYQSQSAVGRFTNPMHSYCQYTVAFAGTFSETKEGTRVHVYGTRGHDFVIHNAILWYMTSNLLFTASIFLLPTRGRAF